LLLAEVLFPSACEAKSLAEVSFPSACEAKPLAEVSLPSACACEANSLAEVPFPSACDAMALALPIDFIDRVGIKLAQQNLDLAHGNVAYVDNGIGDAVRKKAFEEGNFEMFFWKDDFFKYQQEYRLAVLGEFVESHFILNIGKLSEKPMVMNTVDFLDGNVTFGFQNKSTIIGAFSFAQNKRTQ